MGSNTESPYLNRVLVGSGCVASQYFAITVLLFSELKDIVFIQKHCGKVNSSSLIHCLQRNGTFCGTHS